MSLDNEIKSLTCRNSRVHFLLKNYPALRSNDSKLWVAYLAMFHNLQEVFEGKKPVTKLCKLVLSESVPYMSTITRVRQMIQKSGKFRGKRHTRSLDKSNGTYTVLDRVKYLLENNLSVRQNDKKLWLSYLITFHNMNEIINESPTPYEEFCDIILDPAVPAIDSIRRARQKLQVRYTKLRDVE